MSTAPGQGQIAYAKYSAQYPGLVDLSGANPRLAALPAEASRGGPLDGKLDGWAVEFWDVPNPATPFATVVVTPHATIFAIILCLRGGPAGDHLQILDAVGGVSRQGPVPPVADLEAWSGPTYDMTLGVLARHVLRADGQVLADDRTRAEDAPAFVEYAQHNRVPLVESWVVLERIEGPGPVPGWIEIWDRTVDRRTHPPHPYHTPRVAAGYRDGKIVGMVAVETMPEHHDDVYLISFEGPQRRNHGKVADIGNPSVFRLAAIDLLNPLLHGPTTQTEPRAPGALQVVAVHGGDRAFVEVGTPIAVSVALDGHIAIAGTLVEPTWTGQRVTYQPSNVPLQGWNRLAVYDRALRCTMLLGTGDHPIAIGFSPDSTHLVGGALVGGSGYLSSVINVIDVATGRPVHAHMIPRGVATATWVDDLTIEVVARVHRDPDESDQDDAFLPDEYEVHIVRATDWGDPDSVVVGVPRPHPGPAPAPSYAQISGQLRQIAFSAGSHFEPRLHVWAVEPAPFGVIAALDGVTIEAWELSGALRYRLPVSGKGVQLLPVTNGRVLAATEPPYPNHPTRSAMELIDVDTGQVLRHADMHTRSVVSQAAGSTFLRTTSHGSVRHDEPSRFVYLSDEIPVPLGAFDLLNSTFQIRRAPDVLALVSTNERRVVADRQVARVLPPSDGRPARVEHLFAFEWEANPDDQRIHSGPGVFVADDDGDALLHTGYAFRRSTERAFVVRRTYPTGDVVWVARADGQPVGIDEHHGVVFVAFLGAKVMGYDARTGAVRYDHVLELGGHRVEPLSLACGPDGDVYIGTVDGRIIHLIQP